MAQVEHPRASCGSSHTNMADSPSRSIVEYFTDKDGYKCGYCKQENTCFSDGMWAHTLTCEDYQDLIDRGWRRSGKYCYKPTMNRTCCPSYTIKCNAIEFKASKSQKKTIKQVNKYLTTGEAKKTSHESGSMPTSTKPESSSPMAPETNKGSTSSAKQTKKQPRPGLGTDASKPPCRKAKTIRMERKQQKLASGVPNPESTSKQRKQNHEKSLEELLLECTQSDNPAHRLEMKLVRADMDSEEFKKTFKASHRIYQKYQVAIHKDPPQKVDERQFQRFLIDSPLKHVKGPGTPSMGFGSFHQQYYIDGNLFAVGVIDILPRCVSSVYLFYDPDYDSLCPGIYSALREIYFVQQLHKEMPSIQGYYMGFYIHSCPKMNYKGNYYPSYLVCPETYNWVPIKDCLPKLDVSKYSRLDDNGAVPPRTEINTVLILYQRQAMPYQLYVALKSYKGRNDSDSSSDDDDSNASTWDTPVIQEYADLIGPVVAKRMLLFRH